MKKLIPILVLFYCAAGAVAWAGSSLPRGVHKFSELEDAKSEATEKGVPLIFVYTELNSTCPLCSSATDDIFKSFRSRGTMVFLDSKTDDLKNAPRTVIDLRMEPKMGRTYPMVMVTSADATRKIKGYPYSELKGGEAGKAARDLRKTLESVDAGGESPGADATADSTPAAKPDLLAEEQIWRNAAGKTITAAVKRVSGTSVTFILPGGKTVDYPLAKLSEESQDKLRELAE